MESYIWFITNAIQFNLADTDAFIKGYDTKPMVSQIYSIKDKLIQSIQGLKPIINPYYNKDDKPYMQYLPKDIIEEIHSYLEESNLPIINKQFVNLLDEYDSEDYEVDDSESLEDNDQNI